jgi:superfamily II DNA or RNA helicase
MSNTEVLLDQSLWIPLDSELARRARSELQYIIPSKYNYGQRVRKLYRIDGDYLVAPRHFKNLRKTAYTWVGPGDYPELKSRSNIQPHGQTEADVQIQKDAFKFLAEFDVNPALSDAFVCLRCGGGKTCIGLRAAYDRGQHFIVIAHTKDILSNWHEEISKHTDAQNVGAIISREYNPQEITLALTQTLAALPEDKLKSLRHQFGTVILDEVHHYSAEEFSVVSNNFSGRRIGLSATMVREDGASFIYRHAMGKKTFYREIARKQAEVYFKHIRTNDVRFSADYAKSTSMLTESRDYMGQIVADILEGYRGNHKQLVLSNRKDMLLRLSEDLKDINPGLNIGSTPATERKKNLRTKAVILAVDQLGREGLNEPDLTQLRVLTPVKDHNALVQMVGRLERGNTEMQAFFYAANYVPFVKTMHKAKEALIHNNYLIQEIQCLTNSRY